MKSARRNRRMSRRMTIESLENRYLLTADLVLGYVASNTEDSLSASDFVAGMTALDLGRGVGVQFQTGNGYTSKGWTLLGDDSLEGAGAVGSSGRGAWAIGSTCACWAG